MDWLQRELPQRAGRVINRIRQTRQGNLSDARFGSRMKGEGEIAGTIESLFKISARRHKLDKRWSGLSTEHFVHISSSDQFELF